jgi:hypothetical protein
MANTALPETMPLLAPEPVKTEVDHTSVSSTTTSAESGSTADEDETLKIVGEIVGGFKLGNSDDGDSMRPYCMVKFGHSIVHRTKEVEDGCGRNPIWTFSTHSHFLFEASPRELAHHDLHVSVWYKQKDSLNITTLQTCCLGKVDINAAQIFSKYCNEERLEVELSGEEKGSKLGTLTLRFRLATPSDEAFLERLYRSPKHSSPARDLFTPGTPEITSPWDSCSDRPEAPLVTELDEAQLAGTSFVNAISSAFTMQSYMDRASGQLKSLVKPGPDPNRIAETTYLSKQEIKRQTFLPSVEWVEAGSGSLGKLYLEILSCSDLPNVDVGEAVGNVTDCFICAVFEDAMVQTAVINDELSPRWLPWTQRAFCMNIMHPASMLYLGAFDFDLGMSDHDPVGRVAVNLSNLQHNTECTLTYNLYPSSNVTDRTSAGSVTIRVRVEYADEKAALMAGFRPRPKFHVNVNKEKSLKVVRYTCFGEFGDQNEQTFDLTVIRSYINEILGYKNVLKYCLGDAFWSLIFWRGQVQVLNLYLPLHSFLFFYAGITLVERPYLAPPFFLLGVAWVMLATLTLSRQHPSPWHRSPSFWEYLEILHHGKSSASIQKIDQNEGLKEAQAYEKAWQERLEKEQKEAAERAARQEHINAIGDESIHTKLSGMIPLDLLERLARYQGMIGQYCRYARFIKIIVTWEEGIVSFWFTACFLAAGLIALLLPWAFILTWTGRILVWGLLGPHMMIVDILLRDESKDEKSLAKAFEHFKIESQTARHRRQDALKLKDTKCLAFGKYVTLVPSFNLSRHYDRPLPSSFATFNGDKKTDSIRVSRHIIPGQQFFGVMVPRTEAQMLEHQAELPQLEQLRLSVDRCIQAILESENCDLVRRLREQSTALEEQGMPSSVGYELISLDGNTEYDSDENEQGDLAAPARAPSSIVIHETLMEEPRSVRYQLTTTGNSEDSLDSSTLRCLDSSTLRWMESMAVHVDTERKLAIVQTRHERRRSMILQKQDPLESLSKDLPTFCNDNTQFLEENERGIEIVLGKSVCERSEEENQDQDQERHSFIGETSSSILYISHCKSM